MIVKCYSLFEDSFVTNVNEEKLAKSIAKTTIRNKLIQAYFDKHRIYFPMPKAQFDPKIFDELFRTIPELIFEVLYLKSEKIVKVGYFNKDNKWEFSSIEKGRNTLFPQFGNKEHKETLSYRPSDERTFGTILSYYKTVL